MLILSNGQSNTSFTRRCKDLARPLTKYSHKLQPWKLQQHDVQGKYSKNVYVEKRIQNRQMRSSTGFDVINARTSIVLVWAQTQSLRALSVQTVTNHMCLCSHISITTFCHIIAPKIHFCHSSCSVSNLEKKKIIATMYFTPF